MFPTYLLVESADIIEDVSVIIEDESIGIIVEVSVIIVLSVVIVVLSVVVVSVASLLQATKVPAIANTANNFFMNVCLF
jgi:hypothetical protein